VQAVQTVGSPPTHARRFPDSATPQIVDNYHLAKKMLVKAQHENAAYCKTCNDLRKANQVLKSENHEIKMQILTTQEVQ
jgi:hypothetical protein